MEHVEARYDLRDLLRVPTLLSLSRVPLAALFPFVVGDAWRSITVLAATGFTDVLDGWVARRWNQCTPLGAVIDGLTDKVFVLTVAVTLLVTGRLTPPELLLLGAREVGELVLLVAVTLHGDRHAFHEEQRAGGFGKAATVTQFAAVMLALLGRPERTCAIVLAAALGLIAVGKYARRVW